MAVVDRDLALHSAELAKRAEVLPGLDMRLVRIEAKEGKDEYHVLQGLRDPTVSSDDPKCCYAYQRWGKTGSRGDVNVQGPMEQSQVEAALVKVFRDLTGSDMGSLAVGRQAPGKFWLQHASEPDLKAVWKYHVSDGVDGKREGWYTYSSLASDEVEEVYAQHKANSATGGSHIRWVKSGHFTYKVDLAKMTQENIRTHKVRAIKRSFPHDLDGTAGAGKKGRASKRPAKAKKLAAGKVAHLKEPTAAGKKTRKRALKVKKGAKKLGKVGSKAMVLRGRREMTPGGLKSGDLVLNRKGKAVFRSRSQGGKKNGIKNIAAWVAAFNEAKAELGLVGFVPCKKGTALYARTRALWAGRL